MIGTWNSFPVLVKRFSKIEKMSQFGSPKSIEGVNTVSMPLSPSHPTPREAFSLLAKEHHQVVILYARTISGNEEVARDLAQEAFLAAWLSWSRFEVTRDFGVWIRGIVRNKWREYCRKNSRMSSWDEDALSRLEETLQQMPPTGFFDQLKDCLEKLPETLRGPVKAHYYDDLSTAEAAAKLETSEAATRKRLQRAREALKACLTQS